MGKKNKGNNSPEQELNEVKNEVIEQASSEENKETIEVVDESTTETVVNENPVDETPKKVKKEKKEKKEKAPKIVDESKSKFAGLSKGLAIAGIIAAVIVICLVAFA